MTDGIEPSTTDSFSFDKSITFSAKEPSSAFDLRSSFPTCNFSTFVDFAPTELTAGLFDRDFGSILPEMHSAAASVCSNLPRRIVGAAGVSLLLQG